MGSRAETRPSRVGFAGKIILRVGFAGGAVAAVGAAIDCGGGDNKAPTPDDIKSPTATVLRTESPMPSATALATQVKVIESPTATIAPTPEPTPTASPEIFPTPTQVSWELAKPILRAPFVPTDFDTVKKSVDLAYEKHPDAVNFLTQQGSTYPKKQIDSTLDNCSDPYSSDVACGRLIRILYWHYFQSGYDEFYQAAHGIYDYFLTTFPEHEADLLFVLKAEFNGDPNSDQDNLPLD